MIAGKRVLGLPREIQEVRNAFAAYEARENWQPASLGDLLAGHGILRQGLVALQEAATTDQATDPASDQVKRLVEVLRGGAASAADLMQRLGLSHRPTFRRHYLEPALAAGLIERTQPDSPRSPTQRYRLSARGWACRMGVAKPVRGEGR